MAVTDQQKLDFLLKKIGFTKTKTGSTVGTGAISGTPKQPFAEAIPSPLIIANGALWNESDQITTTPPGSDTDQIKVYSASSALRMTADATSSGQRAYIAYSTYNDTSSTRLTNWIDTQFGALYLIKVYKGDPNSGGVALSAGATNENWFFDYSAGVLNFNDSFVPSGVTDTNIYIVGYRYIGQTGAPTSGISTFSFKDLTVERNLDVGPIGGISTFRNSINALDIIKGYKYLAAPYSGTTTTLTVTVASKVSGQHRYHGQGSGLGYVIDGYQSPFFTLTPGNTYRFDQSDNSNSNHQIKFYLEADKTTLYEEGVTYNGTAGNSGAYTQIVVSDKTPVVLHYQCINHGYMGNAFQTNANVVNTNYEATIRSGLNVTGVSTFSGEIDANGRIVGAQLANVIPFYYDYVSQFPSASTYHGAVAHAHNTGRLYFAHAGWKELVNKESDGRVGLGTESYFINSLVSTSTTATSLNVVGVSTFGGNLDINADIDVDGHTNLDNLSVAGVSTFTGDATFSGSVSIGGTLTYEDVTNVDSVGLLTARSGIRVTGGVIEALAGENKIPSLYANMAALPSPSTYHGMFAHVHSTGRGYFAHGGAWYELVNADLTGRVGTGTESYFIDRLVSTSTTATSLNVVGVATFGGNVDVNGNVFDADGHVELDNVNIAGVTTFAGNIDANGDLDVDGHTNLDNVSISGVTTITSAAPELHFTDTNANSDYSIVINSGQFRIRDETNSTNRFFVNSDGHVDIVGRLDAIGGFHASANSLIEGNLELSSTYPSLTFTDTNHNSDYRITNDDGKLIFYDITNGAHRLDLYNTGNIKIYKDLEVDGHTNLDNVNIVGVTTHEGHVLPSADSTYDLGSSSKYWRNVYADSITGGGGGVIIGDDIITRNLQVNGISTHVGIATFNNATFHDDVTFTTANGNNILFDKSDNQLEFGNDVKAEFGANGQLEINFQSNTGNSSIQHTPGVGGLVLSGNNLDLRSNTGNHVYLRANYNDGVDLYFANTKRFETTNTGINVTGDTETDTLNTGNATFTGTISAGGATGTSGQYLKSTGSGVAWASFPTARTSQAFTASAGQTTFSFSYTVGLVDVFVNGIKLSTSEFTATNGSSVVLAVGCFVGDIVEILSYNVATGGGGGGTLSNIVEDTTPQLGGNLDLFSKTINGTGGINITGVVTATSFVGDGSALTGVVGSGSGVVIQHDGSNVGTAGTINFSTNLDVTPISAGIVTVTASGGGSGITTAEVRANTLVVSGVSTFSDNVQIPFDDKKLIVGADNDLELLHTGGNSVIKNTTAGSLLIHANSIDLRPTTESGEVMLRATRNAGVELRYDNTKRFEVTNTGSTVVGTIVADGADINGDIDVDGHTNLDNVSIAGVVTATTFKGALEATSASFSSNIDANGDLDVDGHTNLDNVSIAGFTTFAQTIRCNSSSTSVFTGGINFSQASVTSGNISFVNNRGVLFGSGNELQIFHNSGTSIIAHSGSGELQLRAKSAENGIKIIPDGAVELYHDAVKRLETSSVGVSIPQDLDVDGHTNLDNVSVAGVVTATSFVGDGSGLTGITASGSGVVIKHDGSTVGTAGTINFGTNLDVSAISGGAVTITATGSGSTAEVRTNTLEVVGVTTTGGLLDINAGGQANTFKVEDLTSGRVVLVGTGGELQDHGGLVYSSGSSTLTLSGNQNITGNLTIDSSGNLSSPNADIDDFISVGSNIHLGNAGIITATSFVGDGSGITGVSANIGITTNLSGSFTASAGSPSTINTYGYGTGDIVVEYTVFIKNGSNFQSQKLLAMRDGTTIHSTQFAVMFSSSLLVQLDATISGGNILLRATPETGVSGSTTYKVKREVM